MTDVNIKLRLCILHVTPLRSAVEYVGRTCESDGYTKPSVPQEPRHYSPEMFASIEIIHALSMALALPHQLRPELLEVLDFIGGGHAPCLARRRFSPCLLAPSYFNCSSRR
jgi:hypothetical protein